MNKLVGISLTESEIEFLKRLCDESEIKSLATLCKQAIFFSMAENKTAFFNYIKKQFSLAERLRELRKEIISIEKRMQNIRPQIEKRSDETEPIKKRIGRPKKSEVNRITEVETQTKNKIAEKQAPKPSEAKMIAEPTKTIRRKKALGKSLLSKDLDDYLTSAVSV